MCIASSSVDCVPWRQSWHLDCLHEPSNVHEPFNQYIGLLVAIRNSFGFHKIQGLRVCGGIAEQCIVSKCIQYTLTRLGPSCHDDNYASTLHNALSEDQDARANTACHVVFVQVMVIITMRTLKVRLAMHHY